MPGLLGLTFAAGIMVLATGWTLKFTLVRRAAFTQGVALRRSPVRRCGTAGSAAKPGWPAITGAKSG
jgi:phenylacetyl-CoA:acceptor oxidoreductase subunit 2